MSSAALARKRRANGVPPSSSPQPGPQSSLQQPGQGQAQGQTGRGMTMPQVIHLIDTRLKFLEDFKKDQETFNTNTQMTIDKIPEEMDTLKTNTANMLIHAKQTSIEVEPSTPSADIVQQSNGITLEDYTQFTQEYESRFHTMVTEINDVKDMLMKLQTFTMDVNKKLLEEHLARAKELRDAEQAMRQYNMDSNISTIVADEMPPVFDVTPSNIPEESFENMELNHTNQENIQMTFSDGSEPEAEQEPEQTSSVVFT